MTDAKDSQWCPNCGHHIENHPAGLSVEQCPVFGCSCDVPWEKA